MWMLWPKGELGKKEVLHRGLDGAFGSGSFGSWAYLPVPHDSEDRRVGGFGLVWMLGCGIM